MKKNKFFIILFFLNSLLSFSQKDIPSIYSEIKSNGEKYYVELNGKKYYENKTDNQYSLSKLIGNPTATKNGIAFNFEDKKMKGTLYYGLINYNDSKHPSPVFFKRSESIAKGQAEINIRNNMSGKYDMTDWKKKKRGTIGYRVVSNKGKMLYDGIVSFYVNENKFEIAPTIIEGPFVANISSDTATIWFKTNIKTSCELVINNGDAYKSESNDFHQFNIRELNPDTKYDYSVMLGKFCFTYNFKTSPKPGSRTPFVFSYASDSRAGNGGGERNIYGTNYYIMRKIAALAMMKSIAFMQFTGDMINGYSPFPEELNLEYANWKRSIEPYAHYFPFYAGIGNHEVCLKNFADKKGRNVYNVTNFPFATHSSETVFAKNFVNPQNGPETEDNSGYDPNKDKTDFPSYKETVYYYTYDNLAVIVLNSNYLYSPSIKYQGFGEGNLHGYIMDNQLNWLEKTVKTLEYDKNIDHIFVTIHTPLFPNGGHVQDDMWYNGNNEPRPVIQGKPVKKGIIERRDELLDILINKSSKVVAVLTGDEHNYNKTEITPDVNIYPDNYKFKKLKRNRTIWQINNGSAGAPYYAHDTRPPWTKAVSGFTTQTALVLIKVNRNNISVEVINPDTLEIIETYNLR